MSPRTAAKEQRTCKDCPSPAVVAGRCSRCYQRQRKGLPPAKDSARLSTEGGCSVCGELEIHAKRLCLRCYRRREQGLPDEPVRQTLRHGLREQLSVGVSVEVDRRVRAVAAKEKLSLNRWLRAAIEARVAERLEQPPPATRRTPKREREDEGRKRQLNVGVEESIAELARELAERAGQSLNEWIREAIDAAFKRTD